MMDLANELIGLVRGKEISKQSIALMHSLSHMARVGTEAYAEDILIATSKIKAVLGQQIEVVPLPHLFAAGCTDPLAIRTAAEFTSWAAKVYGEDGKFLTTGFQMTNFVLQAKVGEEAQVDCERLARMPTSLKWPSTKATWIFSGYVLRQAIQPVSTIMEAEIIKLIIKDLRTGLALDLEVSPSFDCMAPVKGGGQQAKTDYLVIGRSSAVAMMASALEKSGKKVQTVHQQEWRVTKAFVTHTAEATAKAIKEYRPEVVILTGLDESYYMAQFEEVHTCPARRDLEGRYHIDGDLVVASKDAQLRLLSSLEPVWKATVGYKTIVVGPMLRYITGGCCDDPEHIPNRNKPDFAKNLKREMVVAKNTLREFLRTSGNHHCRVLDPGMDMASKEPEEIWGDDPTQPRPEVYSSMVAALPMAEARIDTGKRRGEGGQEPEAKRPRQESSDRRRAGGGGEASSSQGTNRGGRGGHHWPAARGRGGRQRQEGWHYPRFGRRFDGGDAGGRGSSGGGSRGRGGSWRMPRGGGGWRFGGRGFGRY
jgi:hypothetical protein